MSALRQAAHDYIDMRRGLGFKFEQAGRGLIVQPGDIGNRSSLRHG